MVGGADTVVPDVDEPVVLVLDGVARPLGQPQLLEDVDAHLGEGLVDQLDGVHGVVEGRDDEVAVRRHVLLERGHVALALPLGLSRVTGVDCGVDCAAASSAAPSRTTRSLRSRPSSSSARRGRAAGRQREQRVGVLHEHGEDHLGHRLAVGGLERRHGLGQGARPAACAKKASSWSMASRSGGRAAGAGLVDELHQVGVLEDVVLDRPRPRRGRPPRPAGWRRGAPA